MSEIEILENLKKYLQLLLDNGTHKIFYNDLFWSEKTIDCINAINDLQQENKQLKEEIENIKTFKFTIKTQQQMIDELINKIDKAIKYINDLYDVRFTDKDKRKLLEILGDKENGEE